MTNESENQLFLYCLARTGISNPGPPASWLLTVIWLRPQRQFKNHELQTLCGGWSTDRLVRLRKKAIDAGWLEYTPGNKEEGGTYKLTVPLEALSMGLMQKQRDAAERRKAPDQNQTAPAYPERNEQNVAINDEETSNENAAPPKPQHQHKVAEMFARRTRSRRRRPPQNTTPPESGLTPYSLPQR